MNLDSSGPEIHLSILIVSYKTPELVLECLESVFRETQSTRIEVFVWDNASGDGSAQAISTAFPDVHLVASPENIGFGAATNCLAAKARGDKILLLNPDTVILDGAIDQIHAFAHARPEAQLWGGRTVYPDGRLNPTSCWALPTLWGCFAQALGLSGLFAGSEFFNPEGLGGWERDSEREVEMISGCFLLINTHLWQELGGFDPLYWMYSEDADLCFRALLAGARPLFTPSATICHLGGASEAIRADKVVRLFRARSQFLGQHWTRRRAELGVATLDLFAFVRWACYSLVGAFLPQKFGKDRSEWAEIWRRRHEWKDCSSGPRG